VWGVWGFNSNYVLGIWIWDLPIEEWMFFFFIPYSCMFIYASINTLFPSDKMQPYAQRSTLIWMIIIGLIAFIFHERLYTGIKLSLTALMLLYVWLKKYQWLGKFYRAYLISLLPFLIVNGILTKLPVVIYNDHENLGVRIFSIPVEDTQYTLLMLLMNTVLFEFFIRKQKIKPLS
jgi:lycopene cyclase domain-containing protein